LETALPAKFEATMVEALGHNPPRPEKYIDIEALPQRFAVLTTSVDKLKEAIAKGCNLNAI
jgi:threonine synthase